MKLKKYLKIILNYCFTQKKGDTEEIFLEN